MERRTRETSAKRAAGAWVLLLAALGGGQAAQPERFEFQEVHMGMDFRIVFYADAAEAANRAAGAVWDRIEQLDQALSDYRADSELMRAVAAADDAPVAIGDDLWRVLERSREMSAKSEGAFDVTVGPLTRVWRRARRQRQAPRPEEIDAARAAVGWRDVELDPQARTLRLTRGGMRLDLGGIAVGYTVDAALAVLAEQGIRRALVDGSGDIGVAEPPPGESGWRIRVETLPGGPTAEVVLSRAAITTASDAAQHVELDGKRYSHVIDPRRGEPLTVSRSVTVIARDALTADALDTAISVLDIPAGVRLAEQTEGAAAWIVEAKGQGFESVESSRWRALSQGGQGAKVRDESM